MAAEQRSYQNNQPQRWGTDPDWSNRRNVSYPESSPWPASPGLGQFPQSNNQSPANSQSYSPWESNYPQQGLQRSPPESTRMNNNLPNNHNNHNSYYGEAASSTTSIHSSGKTYPQRRPSNRDEFDGPSQLLDKPVDGDYEPKEEDLPQLIDILTQLSAATRALHSVALGLLDEHLAHCVVEAARAGGPEQEVKLREASEAIARLVRS